jgi:hypothetical protein
MQEQIVYQRVVYVQFMMSVEVAKPSNLSDQLTQSVVYAAGRWPQQLPCHGLGMYGST